MAVLAAMPRASVTITRPVKNGTRTSPRRTWVTRMLEHTARAFGSSRLRSHVASAESKMVRCEGVTTPEIHRAIDAVWRIEAPKLVARLTRIVRDVGIAEDLAHDALVVALEHWPESGVPGNPGAWLMAT